MGKIPIRLKLSLMSATLVVAVVVTLAAFTFVNFYHEQLEALDWTIEAAGRQIVDLPAQQQIRQAADDMARYEPRAAFAIFHTDGRAGDNGGEMNPDLARNALGATGAITVRADDGRGWRMMAFRHAQHTIVIAQNMDEVYDVILDLVTAYALSLPFIAALVAFGAWRIAGRALRPLRALTDDVEKVQAEKLNQRVREPPARDEIRRLALVFNSMLARLEKSFGQARRFSADASHELQTPLAILCAEVEQLMREPGLTAAHEARLVSIQEEMGRLQRTTGALLLLARLDSGGLTMRREPFDMGKLVRQTCADGELLATSRDVRLETKIAQDPNGAPLMVNADEDHVRRVLLNLLDNAVKFNESGGRIECSLAPGKAAGTEKRVVVFRIGNTGAGIPGAMRAELFQRFFRMDASRAREGAAAGSGLGLSLSHEIARANCGELALDEQSSTEGWTEFVLTLPCD